MTDRLIYRRMADRLPIANDTLHHVVQPNIKPANFSVDKNLKTTNWLMSKQI